MSWIWAIIAFFNNLWSAYKEWQAAREAQRQADAEIKRQAREKAEEDLKSCKTEQECDDASDRLHDNS